MYGSAWISIWGSENVGMTVNAWKAEEYFESRFLFFPSTTVSLCTLKTKTQTVDNHGLLSLQVTGELRWGVWCLNFWQQPDKSSCPNATVPGTFYNASCCQLHESCISENIQSPSLFFFFILFLFFLLYEHKRGVRSGVFTYRARASTSAGHWKV